MEKLCGIGEKTSRFLSKFGIRTLGDLASFPVPVLKNELGKVGEWLHLSANGIDDSPVVVEPPLEKSIYAEGIRSMGHARTLPRDINDPDEIFSVLLSLSSMVAKRLRQKGLQGRTITLKLRYFDFVTLTRSQTIPQPTDSEHKIYQVAKKLALNHCGSEPTLGFQTQNSSLGWGIRKVRLLGVSVSHLEKDTFSLQTCFPFSPCYDKRKEVYSVMDKIKNRFGEDSIAWATSLLFW